MGNAIYPKFKEAAFRGLANVDVTSGTIKVMLVDTSSYTYSASHEFLSDVPSGARVATATLTSPTMVGGLFDAADVVFSAVSGATAEAIVIYKDTGVEGTSRLISYHDTSIPGLPITPTGGDVAVIWHASGIWQD